MIRQLAQSTLNKLKSHMHVQPHYGQEPLHTLQVSYAKVTNQMSQFPKDSFVYIIKDWRGYVTATDDINILAECIKLESAAPAAPGCGGALRKSIYGVEIQFPPLVQQKPVSSKNAKPKLTLADLGISL